MILNDMNVCIPAVAIYGYRAFGNKKLIFNLIKHEHPSVISGCHYYTQYLTMPVRMLVMIAGYMRQKSLLTQAGQQYKELGPQLQVWQQWHSTAMLRHGRVQWWCSLSLNTAGWFI